jgi:predicted nucleic acid-binding protein
VIHPNANIMRRAAAIRGYSLSIGPRKIPLLDCIIRATAEAYGRVIITRNPRDFYGINSHVRTPYALAKDGGGNVVAVNIEPPG